MLEKLIFLLSLTFICCGAAVAGDSGSAVPTKADWDLLFCHPLEGPKNALEHMRKSGDSAAWHDYCAWSLAASPQSIDEARRAVAKAPDDWRFMTTLAILNCLFNHVKEAQQQAEKILAVHPASGRALIVMAFCSDKRGDSEKALAFAMQAMESDPDDYLKNMQVFEFFSLRKDREIEAKVVERLIAACPNASLPYMLRGKLERDRHEIKAAVADLKKSLLLDPDNAAASSMLGRLFEQVGLSDDALNCYNETLKHFQSPEIYARRARILSSLGKLPEAAADYSAAIRISNKPADENVFVSKLNGMSAKDYKICWVRRTELQAQMGETAQALESANTILHIDPACDVALQVREEILRRAGKYLEAIQDLNKLIALDDDVSDWYKERGNSYSKLNRKTEALADFERAKHLDEFGE